MSINEHTQNLTLDNLITLYILDFTNMPEFDPSIEKLYLCRYTDANKNNIVYNGVTFDYIDIGGNNFAQELGNVLPESRLRISYQGLLQNEKYRIILNDYIDQFNSDKFDWRGVVVQRIQTFERYLNTPNESMVSNWLVQQISSQTNELLQLSLSSTINADQLSNTAMNSLSANRCNLIYRKWDNGSWKYTSVKDGGCPYGNPEEKNNWTDAGENDFRMPVGDFGTRFFNLSNMQITDESKDVCSYNVNGCLARFDKDKLGYPFPFTGLLVPNKGK